MIYFFFILLHCIHSQPLFNLYYTDLTTENNDIFEHDCLQSSLVAVTFGGKFEVMFFCLSENPSVFDIKDNGNTPKFTFAQLSNKNITAEQMFYWSAPIDTIEKYQDYLNTKNINLKNELFYNCSLGRFGDRCQYEFNILNKYSSLHFNIFLTYETFNSYLKPITCYKYLECNRGDSTTCLDWRDICNGQIDCLNDGIDEKDCWQLEVKQCKHNEHRCLTGQCMPKSTALMQPFRQFCFEEPLRTYPFTDLTSSCSNAYNVFTGCDDIICTKDLLKNSCHRNHERLILIAMHSNENVSLSKNCSLASACLLNPLTCKQFCQKHQCIRIIQDYCPDTFFYPHIPVLFGNIYFAYTKRDFINSTNSLMIMPYICYNTTDYDDFFHSSQTLLINNIRCIHGDEFYPRINKSYSSTMSLDILGGVYETLQRYHLSMSYTTELCDRSNMYQCINSSKCINIFRILDGIYDCPKMDDETISLIKSTFVMEYIEKNYFKCSSENKYIPDYFVGDKHCDCGRPEDGFCEDESFAMHSIKRNIIFQHICDRFPELLPISIDGFNHTDETECEHWECNNIYTHCNKEWNCLHAEDEVDCLSGISSGCPSNLYRCVSPQTYEFICLPLEKINDGLIDCLSGTDEDIIRIDSFSHSYDSIPNNFYCINQSSYSFISKNVLCNGHNDCEHGDDEHFCTTHQTNPEYKICTSSPNDVISDVERFLCQHEKPIRYWTAIQFKISSTDNNREMTENRLELTLHSTKSSLKSVHECYFGIPITVWLNQKNKPFIFTCFCPPKYYGPQCQYQNQRVSLKLQFQTLSHSVKVLFIIIVSLIDDSHQKLIHSYHSFTYLATHYCDKSFLFTLHYANRPKNLSRQYFIRVDFYEKKTLYHRGSVLFPIEFSFLPVHRLGFIVDIPSNHTQTVHCKSKQCQHGRCMKYWNQLDDLTYCQCDQGWTGKYCQIPYECDCSSDAFCFDVLSNNRSICLCPKNRFGTRCLISSSACEKNINSTCLHGDDCIFDENYHELDEQFVCLCKQGYSGLQCDKVNEKLILSFDKEIYLSQTIFIHFVSPLLVGSEQLTIFRTIPIGQNVVTVYSVRDFYYYMIFIELQNGNYYFGDVLQSEKIESIFNKTIRPSDHCPNIRELFNETFIQWDLIRRIKYYHLPCQNQSFNLSCFYDEVHFCLCYDFNGKRLANCIQFEHNRINNCFGRSECEHDSQCIQDHERCPKQSLCICEECSYGQKCQLRTDQFGLSLDAILGYEILPTKNFSSQPSIVKISLVLTIMLMIMGLINSIISLISFANKNVREVGCGLYLLGISVTTIFIIILFSLKFILLLLTHMTIITNEPFLDIQCHSLDFLIRVCLCLEQWLTACVACERAITVILGAQFSKEKSKEAAKKVILIFIIVVMLTFIHDPLSRDLSYETDEDTNENKRIWCIVRYGSNIEIYNYIIQTFHFIGPFLVNLISVVMLIIRRARQHAAVVKNRSFNFILGEQFNEHKYLLIAPIVLVILAIPRMILIYTTKCMRSANDTVWFYLLGYFISFIPSMLTFLIFILPSKFYKDELKKTIVRYKKIIRRRLHLTS